jgi:beta-N-acetylhexosaminidase
MDDVKLRVLALRTLLAAFPGTTAPAWAHRLVAEGLGGVVLFGHNITGTGQTRALVASLRADRPDLIVALDEEGGDVTRLGYAHGSRYPGNAALGAVDDVALTRAVYRALGDELAALGITLDLAPSVDVNSADDNPIIGTRSFGTDPARVAAHAAAAVTGLAAAGVAACAKHFPGHGATRVDSHDEVPVVDAPLPVLLVRDLPPFAAAIAAGAPAVMTAHIRVPAVTGDEPATFSRAALVDLLRGELGFTGAVITDALEMGGAAAGIGLAGAAVRSLAAGADLLCLGARITEELVEAVVAGIVRAVHTGELPADRLTDAAERATTLAHTTLLSVPTTPTPTGPIGHGGQDGQGAPATRGGLGDPAGSAGPAGPVGGNGDGSVDIGLVAARRAVKVHGVLPSMGRPLVVELDAPPTAAVGEVPWGLLPYLAGADADVDVVRLRPPDGGGGDLAGAVDEVVRRSGGRPIVVVSRDTHRHAPVREMIERMTAAHPRVVMVEMGWPAWRPVGALGYLATYGAGPANARAATELLLDPAGGGDQE